MLIFLYIRKAPLINSWGQFYILGICVFPRNNCCFSTILTCIMAIIWSTSDSVIKNPFMIVPNISKLASILVIANCAISCLNTRSVANSCSLFRPFTIYMCFYFTLSTTNVTILITCIVVYMIGNFSYSFTTVANCITCIIIAVNMRMRSYMTAHIAFEVVIVIIYMLCGSTSSTAYITICVTCVCINMIGRNSGCIANITGSIACISIYVFRRSTCIITYIAFRITCVSKYVLYFTTCATKVADFITNVGVYTVCCCILCLSTTLTFFIARCSKCMLFTHSCLATKLTSFTTYYFTNVRCSSDFSTKLTCCCTLINICMSAFTK